MSKVFQILLILVVFLLVGLAINKYFGTENPQIPQENIVRPSVTPAKTLKSIDDNISYIIPEGWKKVITLTDLHNFISLQSSDYKPSAGFGPEVGAEILITSNTLNPGQTLQDLENDPASYLTNRYRRKVGNLDAVCMTVNYEGYSINCSVISGPYIWNFVLEILKADESTYTNEFKSFLDSVKFQFDI